MLNESVLDARMAALEAAHAWSPRVVSKLEGHIRSAGEDALYRINPLTFASDKGIAEEETIDLFLHAAASNLFWMDWQQLCPGCSCVVESFGSLTGVHNGYECPLCRTQYEAVLDDLIAVTFTVSPEVRSIALHTPELLSAFDRIYKVAHTRDGLMSDGTPFVDLEMALTHAAVDLPAGETTRIEVDAESGALLGMSIEGRAAFRYQIADQRAAEPQHFTVVYGEKAQLPPPTAIAAGHIVFDIENRTPATGTFCVLCLPPGVSLDSGAIRFVPYLTGKRVLGSQTFRDLFRSEVIRSSAGIGVRDITVLFTDLKGSTALYEAIGDLNAFMLVQRHFDRLQEVTNRHGGAVVKTIGDAIMATFGGPDDAVRAAMDMLSEIAAFNSERPDRPLLLKIGIHRGASIVVTLNERLDFFGQTVNVASRVQALADAGEIFLTREVYELPSVTSLLQESFAIESKLARLRGVHEEVPVLRATPLPANAGAD